MVYNQFLETAFTGSGKTATFQITVPCKLFMGIIDVSSSVAVYPLYVGYQNGSLWKLVPGFSSLSLSGTAYSTSLQWDEAIPGYYCFKPDSAESGSCMIMLGGHGVVINPADAPTLQF